MSTRIHPQGVVLLAVAAVLFLAPQNHFAAQREHNGIETFAAPDGTRVVIDVATVDVQLRTADVSRVEVATELKISGVGEERAEKWVASHMPVSGVSDDRITVTVSPGRSGFLGLGTLTARARLGFLLPGHVVPDITTTGGSISIRGDLPLEIEPPIIEKFDPDSAAILSIVVSGPTSIRELTRYADDTLKPRID